MIYIIYLFDTARTQEVGTTESVLDLSGDGLSSKDKDILPFKCRFINMVRLIFLFGRYNVFSYVHTYVFYVVFLYNYLY